MSNIIMLTRGDTFSFSLDVEDANSPYGRYRLTENDALYFGLTKPHQPFEHAIIKRKYTAEDQDNDGFIATTLSANETAELLPGVYYYSVKLRQNINTADEKVTTIIAKTKFIVND